MFVSDRLTVRVIEVTGAADVPGYVAAFTSMNPASVGRFCAYAAFSLNLRFSPGTAELPGD